MPPTIVVAGSAEAGGADCLIPVVIELRRRGRTVHVVAGPRAHHLFAQAGVSFEHATDAAATAVAERLVQTHAPAVVLTGLVGPKDNLDYALIRAAKHLGRPVVSALDSWMNYADRLRLVPDGPLSPAITPDVIAVMDGVALAEMVEDGVPAELCAVTGHPKFDSLAARGRPTSRLRERYGIDPDEVVLTFFSHSITEAYPENQLGYTEADAVGILFEGIRQLGRDTGVFLLFKEHPRAKTAGLDRLVAPRRFRLIEDGDADELMLGSDVVASMASTMLVFAAGLGIPVISIQPNLVPGEDRCILTRRRHVEAVGSAQQFVAAFRAALESIRDGVASPLSGWALQDGKAGVRVANLVDRRAGLECS